MEKCFAKINRVISLILDKPHSSRRRIIIPSQVGLHTLPTPPIGDRDDMGRKTGKWTYFHASSVPSLIEKYEEGLLNGEFTTFHDNGAMKYRCVFSCHKMHGLYEEWDRYGVIRAKGLRSDGYKKGVWIYYDSNGNEERRENFY